MSNIWKKKFVLNFDFSAFYLIFYYEDKKKILVCQTYEWDSIYISIIHIYKTAEISKLRGYTPYQQLAKETDEIMTFRNGIQVPKLNLWKQLTKGSRQGHADHFSAIPQ